MFSGLFDQQLPVGNLWRCLLVHKNVHDSHLCREYYQLELVVSAYLFKYLVSRSECDHMCIVSCLSCNCNWNLWRCLLVHYLVFCSECDHLGFCGLFVLQLPVGTCGAAYLFIIWSFVVDVNISVFWLVCPAIAIWNLWRCLLVHYLVFCCEYDHLCRSLFERERETWDTPNRPAI